MSGNAGGSGLNNARNTPKDAQVMISLLREMGISDYEPRVLDHMLDFTYKYVTNILEEARVYSSHSKKRNIDIDDIRLAIQLASEKSFTNPPPRDMLMDIARTKNAQALPLIKSTTGARLPPDRYTLTSTNYRCKTKPKPPQQKMLQTGGQQTLVSKSGSGVTIASKAGTAVVVAKPSGVAVNVSAKPKPISVPLSGMPPINIVSGEWKRKAEDETPQ